MPSAALNNVTPIRPHLEVVESSRVADLDAGYTRLANELLESYAGADLTKRQFKVLLAILRKTYGWNKPMDRISDSQLAEITGLPVRRCNEAKLDLVRMGLVKQQGRDFGPNKNMAEWCIPQSEGNSPKTREKNSPKTREQTPSKQGDTKDTITKEKKDIKNTMPEEVRAKREKASPRHEETDQAFEDIFWRAGMVKTGKVKARSAFEIQLKAWRKVTGGSAAEFASMLAQDIQTRIAGDQFGFDRLHPTTYLNGQRWNDEKPAAPATPGEQARPTITVSKTGYVFFER